MVKKMEVARNRNLENETETNQLNKDTKRIIIDIFLYLNCIKYTNIVIYIEKKIEVQIKVIENIFEFNKQNKQYPSFISESSQVFFSSIIMMRALTVMFNAQNASATIHRNIFKCKNLFTKQKVSECAPTAIHISRQML